MQDAYRYLTAFSIPLLLIILTAMTRKIVRKTAFRGEDFYLGVELTLAAIAGMTINVVDSPMMFGFGRTRPGPPDSGDLTVAYILLCLFLFVLQVNFHQDWRDRPGSKPWKQILVLGVASNAVGIILLGVFILLKMEAKI